MARAQDTMAGTNLQSALMDDPEFLRGLVEAAVQRLLNAQFEASMGAAPYERNDDRKGYRNGSYSRSLKTRVGQIELQVPRDREGRFCPTLFRAYERHEQAFQLALMEMVLHGVSTRKVTEVVEALCGHSLSKSAVSAMSADLMEGVNEWLLRPLPESFACIMLDATYVKIRENGRVVSRAVLIALGIGNGGEREVIGVQVADRENRAYWGDFIQSLYRRGLKSVAWVVSDQHEGLVQAIRTHFHGATWQRCQVHFARNFLARLSKQDQGKWICRLRDVLNAPSRGEADRRATELANDLRAAGKSAVGDWLEENIAEALNVLALPEHLRKRCASTNSLERLNQEIKRRTNVARIYPNRESLLRVVASLCEHISEKWAGRCYLPAQELVAAVQMTAA